MSEKALPYYLPQFDALDVPKYPILINGQERFLMGSDEKMSLYVPGCVNADVRAQLKELVRPFMPFVMQEHRGAGCDGAVKAQNQRNFDKILGSLFLVRDITGISISGVSIEAVAPEDVTQSMLQRLIPGKKANGHSVIKDPEQPKAFFVIRGLVNGAVSTPVAGIAALIKNNQNYSNLMSPYFCLGSLNKSNTNYWHNQPRVQKKPNPIT